MMSNQTRRTFVGANAEQTKIKSKPGMNQNGYQVEYAAPETHTPIPPEAKDEAETTEDQEAEARKKTLSIIRILVGLAIIMVSAALLAVLLSWLRQDIATSVLFFESEIR